MHHPKYQRAAMLMEAEVGDEVVGLDPQNGSCFGFNSVAASVWRALVEPHTFAELRDGLLEEYDVELADCTAELKSLLDDMTAKGLIEYMG